MAIADECKQPEMGKDAQINMDETPLQELSQEEIPLPELTSEGMPVSRSDQTDVLIERDQIVFSNEYNKTDLKQMVMQLNSIVLKLNETNSGKEWNKISKQLDEVLFDVKQLLKNESEWMQEQVEDNKNILNLLETILNKQDKNDRQLVQSLRQNAEFQVQVRNGMQKDIEALRAQESGEIYDLLLKQIATVYSEYQILWNEDQNDEQRKRNLEALFDQLEEILNEYDAVVVQSKPGDLRLPRQCKIVEKIKTSDQAKHNTIANSRKPGIIRGKRILVAELVDVYVYDGYDTAMGQIEPDDESKKIPNNL